MPRRQDPRVKSIPKCVQALSITDAISKGYFQQVRFLIEYGANVNERDMDGRTPLMLCALVDNEEWGVGIARTLLEKGAYVGYRDKMGLNAMHYACIYERAILVDTFFNAIDFDLNQGDRKGNTALFYAVTANNETVVENIVKTLCRYKMTLDKKNNQGITPLIQAWKSGHVVCAGLLLQNGADETIKDGLENKSAREWEMEFTSKQSRRQSSASTSTSGSRAMLKRPSSAPSLLRRSRPKSASARIVFRRGLYKEIADETSNPTPTKNKDAIIRSASLSDLKNNPEYLFNTNPVECFSNPISTGYPRIGTARERIRLMKINSAPDKINVTWKKEMKILYNEFEFQITPSYRGAAKPPPPPPEDDELLDAEENGEKKPGRKISDGKPPIHPHAELKRRQSEMRMTGNSRLSRRNSVLSNQPLSVGNKRNTLTHMGSSESINANGGKNILRKKNNKTDVEEGSDHGSRPVSRTGFAM
ncbi:unnamed protein product [Owenia fusiformis]|uniref:Uncharacterized protein n=1 Tax=Owenia fusiformis TaxID=6347 RepID=A0A8J1U6Y3_OWEFU|nr:unnamed protein product [Owenia fusiformis]